MRHVVAFIERLTTGVGYLAALVVLPLIVATCYEVLSRYLLGAPTIWAYELGYMATGSHFLLGAALTLKRAGHIRIDLIYDQLSDRNKALIDLVCYVFLFLPFLVLLSWSLWEYAARAIVTGELSGQSAWNPLIWPFRLVFFVGFALLGLQVIAEIIKCVWVLTGRAPGRGQTDAQEA